MDSDQYLIENPDWNPEYLRTLFSHDFYDMNDHWNGTNFISDTDMCQVNEKYCPIVQDISMDDDDL